MRSLIAAVYILILAILLGGAVSTVTHEAIGKITSAVNLTVTGSATR